MSDREEGEPRPMSDWFDGRPGEGVRGGNSGPGRVIPGEAWHEPGPAHRDFE